MEILGLGSALVYLPLQVYTVVRWRGVWRLASLLPILLMVPVFAVTANAYAQQSNLWPIFLILAAPVSTGYLAVLLLIRALASTNNANKSARSASESHKK